MFAKPEWFHSSSLSALPGPRTAKGWAFYAICLAGIFGPAVMLISRQQIFPEAVIWLAFSLLAFFLEMRGLNRDLREREARRNMYHIDDANQPTVQTDQYELEIRSSG